MRRKSLTLSRLSLFLSAFLVINYLSMSSRSTRMILAFASQLEPQHVENFAVIVSTSKYYYNYRHTANAVGIYKYLKEVGGIPDQNIVLMLSDDLQCDARNPLPGKMFLADGPTYSSSEVIRNFSTAKSVDDIFHNVDVDYKGNDVTAENFLRVLTGNHLPGESNSRKLPSHSKSNVLIYMAGHGGDGFIKFNDEEEVMKEELALALGEMRTLGRYHELLFIIDSCQSFTLCDNFDNVDESICIGSSVLGENSYAHHTDMMLGVSIIDQFTRELLIFLDKDKKTSPTATFSRKYSNIRFY